MWLNVIYTLSFHSSDCESCLVLQCYLSKAFDFFLYVWCRAGSSCFFFFFFSSRRRHTRLTCDWRSDVCSSDLVDTLGIAGVRGNIIHRFHMLFKVGSRYLVVILEYEINIRTEIERYAAEQSCPDEQRTQAYRSDERRVGKECR